MNRSRCSDPGMLLARALVDSAAGAGCAALVASLDSTPWASATFIGARHAIVLEVAASIARYRWLAALAVTELPIRGHVALPPAILTATETAVTLEVITLEDH